MQKYDAEITALGERIMKYCPEQEIRLEAAARLAFQHCEMGRKKQGRATYETLPPQRFCLESQIWQALDEDEKLPFTRNFIRQSYDNLKSRLYNIIYGRLLPDEDLILVSEKISALVKNCLSRMYANRASQKLRCPYYRIPFGNGKQHVLL